MLANYEEKLNEIKQNITQIGTGIIEANKIILIALNNCDQEKFQNAKLLIANASNKTNNIDNEIITTLALHSPEARDLRRMVSYLKITNELLRASTNTRSFIKGFQDICDEINENMIKDQKTLLRRPRCLRQRTPLQCN